jgi:muconolactone delta-isomerase
MSVKDHAGSDQAHHVCSEHKAESQELAEEENPLRRWRRVDVFAQAHITFAPDQLTDEVDDEKRYHHAEIRSLRQRRCHVLRQQETGSRQQRNAPVLQLDCEHQHQEHREGYQQEKPGQALRDHP